MEEKAELQLKKKEDKADEVYPPAMRRFARR